MFENITKLLDEAFEAVRSLAPEQQDEIAHIILQIAGFDKQAAPIPLSPEEREEVEAMWAEFDP